MLIEFVNHASFVVHYEDVHLICDPWLSGAAFHNGWNHLCETQFDPSFDGITHIWFSHEHPDHFSPSDIKRIPESIRENITILYQETIDKKVIDFCSKMNFKTIIEMTQDVEYNLNDDISILCNPYTEGDSYLVVRAQGTSLLNLNDCIIESKKDCNEIKQKIGNIDILFTQFGYANRIGNTSDTYERIKASQEKLKRIQYQAEVFQPKYIVPFASYVYFSHEENSYMNDAINTSNVVYKFIEKNTNAIPIIMYPRTNWDTSVKKDSTECLQKYESDYASIGNRIYHKAKVIPEKDLIELSRDYVNRLHKKNPKGRQFIKKQKSRIYLNDHDRTYTLNGKLGLMADTGHPSKCDISLSSEVLSYLLKFEWGGDTMNINGRFQVPEDGDYANFRFFNTVSSMNNRGEVFVGPTRKQRLLFFLKKILGNHIIKLLKSSIRSQTSNYSSQ
ncbi:MAG: MBL fold metallo-hydrolase [Cyclobacteriaceae bacterium]